MISQEAEEKEGDFSIFCWNIQNPSLERAKKQASWLLLQNYDVFIFTECKSSKGCLYLEKILKDSGYNLEFKKPQNGEYATILATKHPIETGAIVYSSDYLQERVVSAEIFSLQDTKLKVVGLYIPSRTPYQSPANNYDRKKDKKKDFLETIKAGIKNLEPIEKLVLTGDFNILEPTHYPRYSNMDEWEYDFYRFLTENSFSDAFRYLHPTETAYSWFGKSGNGYRYDHSFVSDDLLASLSQCYYFSEPLELKLSDHAAIVTRIFI